MNRITTAIDELPAEQAILAAIVNHLGDQWLADGLAAADVGPQICKIHRRAAAHVADCEADLPGRVVSAVQEFAARGFDVRLMRCALEDAFPFPRHRLALHGFLVAFAETVEENRRQRISGDGK